MSEHDVNNSDAPAEPEAVTEPEETADDLAETPAESSADTAPADEVETVEALEPQADEDEADEPVEADEVDAEDDSADEVDGDEDAAAEADEADDVDEPDDTEQAEDSADSADLASAETEEQGEVVLEPVDIAAVEAILFTTDTALSPAKIAEVAGLTGGRSSAREAIEALNARYEQIGSSFRIETQAGGYRMLTLPEYNEVLGRLLKVRSESKLSKASLETLAIVAYKQPILRADIEAVRGVSSGEMVRGLMEKGLVKIVGRAEEIGRPMLYGTTRKFLEVFGMGSLKDLPEVAELAAVAALTAKAEAEADPPVDQEESPAPAGEADAPTETPEGEVADAETPVDPAEPDEALAPEGDDVEEGQEESPADQESQESEDTEDTTEVTADVPGESADEGIEDAPESDEADREELREDA